MTARRAPLLLSLLLTTGCVVLGGEVPGSGGTSAGAGSPPAGSQPASTEERTARALFDRVNDERQERGLGPVQWNDQLAQVARQWSAEMAERRTFEHQDIQALLESDRLNGFRSVGENIFQASAPVPAGTIHVGWMRSDSHRPNILNPGWDRLGVGVHCADDGSVWATQEFGRTTRSDRPPLSDDTPPPEPVARPQKDGPSCAG